MSKTLVVLIIIGLFLSWKFILFPEKLDFTDKVKVLQGLSLALPYKAAIAGYWQQNNYFPGREQWLALQSDAVEVDLEKSIVSTIEVGEAAPGSITVYYTNARDHNLAGEISGKSLTLKPYVYDGKIEWSCKGNVPVEFLPRPCK